MKDLTERPSRFELLGPVWFVDGLKQLSAREGRPVNELIREAVLAKWPEIQDIQRGFIGRLIANRDK